jgi:Tol biopolymer transport system component
MKLIPTRLAGFVAILVVCAPAVTAAGAQLPTPEIFSPGSISGPQNDGAPTFTPDARTLYFERSYGHRSIIFESRRVGAGWSKPRVADFSGPWSDQQPALSPDGHRLFFVSTRKVPSADHPNEPPKALSGIWRVDRTTSGWSKPVHLPSTVNIFGLVFKPSVAANGDLYFMAAAASDSNGPKWRLYRAAWIGGAYQPAQPLSFSDGKFIDVDPYIAPDESYIIFSSSGRRLPDDGHEHLYIALRRGSDWGEVRALRYAGDEWGADDGEAQASPDGKTLYFMSARSAPIDRTKSRQQMLADIAVSEIWDNGNNNAWALPLQALFEVNNVVSPAASATPVARVFAPGVISGPDADMAPAFMPSANTLYFSRYAGDVLSIMVSQYRGGNWSTPVAAPFSGRWNDLESVIAPSGRYLIFASDRPAPGAATPLVARYYGKDQVGGALWRVPVEKGRLGPPRLLPPSVNQGSSNWTPAIASNDDLYFMRTDPDSGRFRLLRSAFRGNYAAPTLLSFSTGEFNDVDPAIDPSERFLIFSSDRGAPGAGSNPGPERLYIAFNPNSAAALICPIAIPGFSDPSESQVEARLSLDGQRLYFSSRHPDHQANELAAGSWDNGKSNIWVIPLLASLWRDAAVSDPACKTRTAIGS